MQLSRPRTASLVALALALAGAWLMPLAAPAWWLGTGLLTAAVVLAWPELRGLGAPLARAAAARPWLWDLLALLVLVLVVTVLLDGRWTDRPISQDHTLHFAKAARLNDRLLAGDGVLGWSHARLAGIPEGYLYPWLADLLVVGVFQGSLGALDLSQAYGVAFGLCLLLYGWGAYRLGQRTFGRAAGLIAALLVLTDSGAVRQGGWEFTAVWGVWPQILSEGFMLLALSRVPALIEQARAGAAPPWREMGHLSLALGLSLLGHPVQLLFWPIALLAGLAALWWRVNAGGAGRALAQLGLCAVIGGAIGAAFLVPFLDVSPFASSIGAPWAPGRELGLATWRELGLFDGAWRVATLLGLIGVALALWRRRFAPLWLAGTALGLLAFAAGDVVHALGLDALEPFRHVQYERLTMLVTPLWFVLAAGAAVSIWRFARAQRPPALAGATRALAAGIIAALAAPMVVPPAAALVREHLTERRVARVSERPYAFERKMLVRWLNQSLPDDRFSRVALMDAEYGRAFGDLAAELKPGVAVYKVGYVPVTNFRFNMSGDRPDITSGAPAALDALGVTYVISEGEVADRPDLHEVATFGPYRVARFRDGNARPVSVEGTGDVEVVAWTDERIELRAGPGAQGQVRLGVAWFPRWRAFLDDIHPLPVGAVSVDGVEGSRLLTVPLAPGTIVVSFVSSTRDDLAWAIAWLGLALALLLLVVPADVAARRRLDQTWARAAERLRRWGGIVRWGRVALVVGLPLALFVALRAFLMSGGDPVVADLEDRLASAEVTREPVAGASKPCVRAGAVHRCGFEPWFHVSARFGTLGTHDVTRCIRAQPRPGERLRLHFPDVPRGDRIEGLHGWAAGGDPNAPAPQRVSAVVTVRVDGEPLGTSRATPSPRTSFDFRLPEGAETMDVELVVAATLVPNRHHCLQVRVTRDDIGSD